jgi:prophage antirepressor-like protein
MSERQPKINFIDMIIKNTNDGILNIVKVGIDFWFVGNEIGSVLGYAKPRSAINSKVLPEDIIYYKDLLKLQKNKNDISFHTLGELKIGRPKFCRPIKGGLKIQSKTIFINEDGLTALGINSPKNKQFKRWIIKNVLYNIRRYGTYSFNTNPVNYKSTYTNENIHELNGQNIVYLAYIGVHKNEQLFKFGSTLV